MLAKHYKSGLKPTGGSTGLPGISRKMGSGSMDCIKTGLLIATLIGSFLCGCEPTKKPRSDAAGKRTPEERQGSRLNVTIDVPGETGMRVDVHKNVD